jgi:hypothetical protein
MSYLNLGPEHLLISEFQKSAVQNVRTVAKSNNSVILDLSKAFDCIEHKLLLNRLYNLYTYPLELMKSYLTNRPNKSR